MKRRGKTLLTPKVKASSHHLHMQHESSEEEFLVVRKVAKQYVRKNNLNSADSLNTTPTINTGADDNHVKIKEESIPQRNYGINLEQSYSLNKIDNNMKVEDENLSDRVMGCDTNLNSNLIENMMPTEKIIIKIEPENEDKNEVEVSETKANIVDVNVNQMSLNKIDNDIKVEEENLSDRVMGSDTSLNSNLFKTVMPTEKIIMKMEPEDDLQCEHNIHDSHTYIPKSEKTKVDELKQYARNNCNSHIHDKMYTSYIERNVMSGHSGHESIQEPQMNASVADDNVQTHRNKILITEEIHIKEEVVSNTERVCVEKNEKAPVSSNKKMPAAEEIKLRRIINMPRLLKTYSKKQPETVTLKKCFLVAVNVPPKQNGKKSVVVNVSPKQKGIKSVAVNVSPKQKGIKSVAVNVPPKQKGKAKIKTPEKSAKPHAKETKEKIYSCEVCGKEFSTLGHKMSHMRGMHRVALKHKCGACAASFTHHYLMLAHARAHRGPVCACDLCPKRFKNKDRYGEHLNTHLRERLFSCPVCLQRYAMLYHLHRHAETHTPEDNFPCSHCNESYRSLIHLTRHSEREHQEKIEFPCYICSKILSCNAEFLIHLKTHNNAFHACAFCPRRFNDAQKWEEHSNEHIEKMGNDETTFLKPYSCEHCKKSFMYKSHLKNHILNHTEERPYECPECFKRFKCQSSLTDHIKGHRRPFSCLECSRRFGKRDSLSRHMFLHSGERPHVCTGCPKTFTQRATMLQHMRRLHEPGLKRVRMTKKRNANK